MGSKSWLHTLAVEFHFFFRPEQCIHWNGKYIRVTVLVFTGDIEDKLQCLQWIPELSTWRLLYFCGRINSFTQQNNAFSEQNNSWSYISQLNHKFINIGSRNGLSHVFATPIKLTVYLSEAMIHWCWDQMTAMLQTFSCIKIVVFWLGFHSNLFQKFQLTIHQHPFK